MAGASDVTEPDEGRDWTALLNRVLEPFRSEAAAFRILLTVIALFGTIIALTLIIRTIF